MTVKYCKKCGTQLDVRAKFCKKCGTKSSNISKKIAERSKENQGTKPFKQTYGMPSGEYDKLVNANKTKDKDKDTAIVAERTEEPFKQTFGMTDSEYSSRIKSSDKKKIFNATFFKYSLIVFVVVLFYSYSFVSDYVSVFISENSASTEIKDIANNSGFNVHGKALFYQSNPELVTADVIQTKCPVEGEIVVEYGCYKASEKKIYILSVNDKAYREIEYSTAAHEVLHVAWTKLPTSEREDISSKLTKEYNNASSVSRIELKDIISKYPQEPEVINNELHSFIGSMISNKGLSPEIQQHYNRYFDNRMLSVNAELGFNSKIESKINELNNRSAGLDRQSAEIDDFKRRFLDVYFYPSQSNIDLYYKNQATYNSKVDIYEKNRIAFNQDVAKFQSVLNAFYPSKTQIQTK